MFSHCLCPYCRYYWAVTPAVLESGEHSKFFISLINPNETLDVTVTLTSKEQNITIFTETVKNGNIHIGKQFEVNCTGVRRRGMYIVALNNSLHVGQQSQKWCRQFPVKNVAGSRCGKARGEEL